MSTKNLCSFIDVPIKDLNDFHKYLKKQEERYFIKIDIKNIRDEKHLDCFWYGGEVAEIKYRNYKIVISAYGDIECEGKTEGKVFDFKDRNNSGAAFCEIGSFVDDEKLHELLESNNPENQIRLKQGNWFEVNLVDPKGNWINLSGQDNVLEDNFIDNLIYISEYLDLVEKEIGDLCL